MNIALIGYGKMGHILEQIALKRGHNIVARIDRDNLTDFDSPEFRSADVAIEFTTPQTAEDNIRHAWKYDVPVVSGTTGWDAETLMTEARQTGHKLIWKSNFSIGVNIFFELNKHLAEALHPYAQYTPSITEVHHIHKLDKPSGTAKTLAEDIVKAISVEGTNIPTSIPIESVREGEVPGTHTITWDSPEDTIIITHVAKGREAFALGAILVAEQI